MNPAADLNDHPRILALLEQFRSVDAAIRDLPIYNDKIAIEAIGFRLFGDAALLGVVITPWFMNLIMLPIKPEAMNMAEVGKTVSIELPIGPRTFTIGGNASVGLYMAHSLHSPVLAFTLRGQAGAEARQLLALLLTPATAEPAATRGSGASGLDRRALLFRRRSA